MMPPSFKRLNNVKDFRSPVVIFKNPTTSKYLKTYGSASGLYIETDNWEEAYCSSTPSDMRETLEDLKRMRRIDFEMYVVPADLCPERWSKYNEDFIKESITIRRFKDI